MTPNGAKFQIQPDFALGTLVWHRADRDRCGVVKGLLITGRHNTQALVSWPDGDETYETLTTITDERPTFDGADHSEN